MRFGTDDCYQWMSLDLECSASEHNIPGKHRMLVNLFID